MIAVGLLAVFLFYEFLFEYCAYVLTAMHFLFDNIIKWMLC